MPAGGIGYGGHFGGVPGSPYSPGGMGMGMGGSMAPVNVAGGGGLGPAVPTGPMVVNSVMQPVGPPQVVMSVPVNLPPVSMPGISMGGVMNVPAMSSPMNSPPVMSGNNGAGSGLMGMQASNLMPTMNNVNTMQQVQQAQQAQAASLQGTWVSAVSLS